MRRYSMMLCPAKAPCPTATATCLKPARDDGGRAVYGLCEGFEPRRFLDGISVVSVILGREVIEGAARGLTSK